MKKIYLVVVVALAVLLVAAAVPAVSAYEETLTDSKFISKDYTKIGGEYAGTLTNGNYLLRFSNIEYWPDLKVVYVRTERFSFSNLTLAKSQDSIQHYVDFIVGGTDQNIGHGYLAYNIFYDGNGNPSSVQFWVEIEEWDITGLAGRKEIRLQLNPDSPLKQFNFVYYRTGDPNPDTPIVFGAPPGTGGGAWNMDGYYIVNSQYDWTNRITITDDRLILLRDGNYSKLTIQTGENVYQEASYDDRSIYINPPISWTVTNLVGTNFTGTYPTDTPEDPSRVMVHIIAQDARNENLLLDAAVEVRDQYDAVVAAGTTSPEGWMVFEYDLPDTLTDEDFDRYYTVSVSLPGWTQKVTNFKFYPAFIPRSGDWIRVEMLPDTDGPADPEKTYIMFFVRDIHANPLERASIEIAGQYWHTNSAGHVAVEVPKNSTTAYTVRKTGHVSISGSAAVGAEGSYVVNIALGPALPDRTPGPGDDPGATPPPRDTRTNEEKGKAVIDLIADNAELIATLAILAAVMGLINLIMPGRRRR